MTAWQMYWLVILDSVCVGSLVIGLLLFFVGVALCSDTGGWSLIGSAIGLILLIASVFLPSTKQMAAILIVPKIVNNAKVQEVPDKLLTLATEWMDELRPKKEKDLRGHRAARVA